MCVYVRVYACVYDCVCLHLYVKVLTKQSHVLSFKKIQEKTENMMKDLRIKVERKSTTHFPPVVDNLMMCTFCPILILSSHLVQCPRYTMN